LDAAGLGAGSLPLWPKDRLTRRPSTSSVGIVTYWSRIPGAHGTGGTAWSRAMVARVTKLAGQPYGLSGA